MEAIQYRTINIGHFAKKFDEEYQRLYDSRDNVPGYREAVSEGDELLKQGFDLIGEFVRYRGDLLTSDRELAAFALALRSFG